MSEDGLTEHERAIGCTISDVLPAEFEDVSHKISLVVDYGVFRRIEAEAQELGLSINSYIVQCSDPLGPLSRLESSKLDMASGLGRIESKIDRMCVTHRVVRCEHCGGVVRVQCNTMEPAQNDEAR